MTTAVFLLGTVTLWNFPPSFSHQSATDSNTHSTAYVTCYFKTTGNTTAQFASTWDYNQPTYNVSAGSTVTVQ